MTASEEFVDWAWRLSFADLPTDVVAKADLHLLDGLGCALAAARLGEAAAAVTAASRYPAPAEAVVPGAGITLSAPYAALATGALVHALDFDDTHAEALVHATAAVLPTLIAVGQRVGAQREELAASAVAGYELVLRLGMAVPHAFHARGFHATSVCGVFAAAMVAARLLDLSRDQAVAALGIAGSSAAGSLEFLATGSDTKALHPGLAALAGITAAELAAAGASGPASIFDGSYGLYASYLQERPGHLADNLGERWELLRVAAKGYPCCQLSHASIDAVRAGGVPPAETVTEVLVELPEASAPIVAEPRAAKLRPRTPYEAKFSLPWTLAALLVDGALTVESFEDVERADVAELATRVQVRTVPFAGPPATAAGRVTLCLTDGAVARTSEPAEPTRDDVIAKFQQNAGVPMSAETAADIVGGGFRIEHVRGTR